MSQQSYVLFRQQDSSLLFVEIPSTHAYQLSALILRLHKELSKLTADNVPVLPHVIAECREAELLDPSVQRMDSLTYIRDLENTFASVREQSYPIIALLTEIRALGAQLEQWYEEEADAQN
jgi:hypothetical protein